VNLLLAKLFFDVGNNKRFVDMMDELSYNIENHPKEKYFYGLLKAFYFEITFDLSKAINELETVIENTIDITLKLQAYNNIARIEEMRNNHLSAQAFYEKAFELLKTKPDAKFFPIVIHNLLIKHAKQKELKKGSSLLEAYWHIVDKNDAEQLVQYANGLIHYARQIDDKVLLAQSYKIIEDNFLNTQNDKETFILELSELRMRYNDSIEFDHSFKKVFTKLQHQKDDFSLLEKLRIMQEFRHVLIQKITTHPYEIQWIEYFISTIAWNLSLKDAITDELKKIESSLSIVRVFWLKQLIELQKVKMTFPANPQELINDLKVLVHYIEEIIRIWEDVNNEVQQIDEIFHWMDEIHSYWKQTNCMEIINIYKNDINIYLNKADMLLEKHWKTCGNKEFLIALAWFFMQFQNNQKKALYWIDKFDSLNISLNHYTQYLREWYSTIKHSLVKQEETI
ncbi:hypothetical protein, partial [Sulfuricurvum sp.]|uniref:hypothetical protein n=1 Tax=Sulfuricurvum sp. TaxID=2025608 RepID=UPI003C52A7F0